MKGAIESLIETNPTPEAGLATLSLGQGTWEVCRMHLTWLQSGALGPAYETSAHLRLQVFYAPHISSLSSMLGTRFQPIRYALEGNKLTSNVFFSSSLAQVQACLRALSTQMPSKEADGKIARKDG